MKKKVLLILLLFLFIPSIVGAKPQDITLKIDGKVVKTDVAPFIKYDRTYVPVRFVAETFGMKVSFDKEAAQNDGPDEDPIVTLTSKNERIIDVYSESIVADGIHFGIIDEYIENFMIVNKRSFVPIRFIGEALHLDISWNQKTKTVELKTNNNRDEYKLILGTDESRYYYPTVYTPSPIYKVIYNGERYVLEPTGLTIQEMLDKNSIESEYIDIFKSEKHLRGHDFFMFDTEKKEVQGASYT